MKGPGKIEKIVPFLLAVVVMTLALWIFLSKHEYGTKMSIVQDIFQRLDYIRYDTKITQWVTQKHQFPDQSIVIIDIDGKSMLEKGPWPWHYANIIELVSELRQQGAKLIVFDTVLNKKEENSNKSRQLVHGFQANANIVLPFLFNQSHYTQGRLPKPDFILNSKAVKNTTILNMPGYLTSFDELQKSAAASGFLSDQKDEDGITRKQLLVARHGNQVFLSLAFAAAKFLHPESNASVNGGYIGLSRLG